MSGLPSTHLMANLSNTLIRWVTPGALRMPKGKEGCWAEHGPLGMVQFMPGSESAVGFWGLLVAGDSICFVWFQACSRTVLENLKY